MLTKFESKSNRVKGLAFHDHRPWILTALHNGVVQLWDYRMGTLLDRFDEHDGPVRGVAFHKTQPLFVSGGDDYKLKVWDYKLRRCLFTLLGHLDYIRTVEFHHEYPWIISCSDDQTVRIWNWQSRSCVAVLTGHNHYVMCARFHPKEDMVVSASLDQTVRVWDTTGLRKKNVRGAPPAPEDQVSSRVGSDLFGANDAVVKYVLEGHERGVNWASFHPTLPLIVSGADDRQVKLWRMNETKAWEVDTMRGHTNNVSCALFHPRHELIISNSEDRSIRVWDISKRMGIQTFRRENDRFWVLAAHPTQNLLAAGHDSGMIVFKLERERPAMGVCGENLFYVRERYLRMHNFSSSKDAPVVSLRRTGTLGTGIGNIPRTLQYNVFNPNENNVLLWSDSEGGSYELLCFSKDGSGMSESQDSRRGAGLAAVFVARDRFAILDKSNQIVIKNLQNEVTKTIAPPNGAAEAMFFGGTVGRLLLRVEDKILLYENQSRRVLAEIQAPRVKYVVWSDNYNHVALMSKNAIVIANRQLDYECTISESIRIKSGIFDKDGKGIFVYTTLNHIKYCLPSGDSGIIRTLDTPIYLTQLDDNVLHCIDREGKTRTISLDLTECLFKIALGKKQYSEVMRMIKHTRLCGQAIISYLTEMGYPEVALHFVSDWKTRFKLAISCGNLEVAMNAAYELDDDQCWHQLGIEALRQGNLQAVEMAYQRTKNFERLSFLYLITGNRGKLEKMLKIAEKRNDVMGRFHNALYLGNVEERVSILESVGQLGLALVTAKAHGLEEDAARLLAALEELKAPIPESNNVPSLLLPPVCIYPHAGENWPLMPNNEPKLEDAVLPEDEPANDVVREASAWDADEDLTFDESHKKAAKKGNKLAVDFGEVAGDEWDEDLDLGEDDEFRMAVEQSLAMGDVDNFVAAPTAGVNPSLSWVHNSSVAADHVAAGSFETAMQLLNRQIGIINFGPLKPHFMSIYTGASTSLPTFPSLPPLKCYLYRTGAGQKSSLPATSLSMAQLTEELKNGYRAFTAARFADMKTSFDFIIHSIPLLVVNTREEVGQVKELLGICRDYLTGYAIRMAVAAVSLESDPKRNVELSAYFTHCNLQPSHLLLVLKIAMTSAFKSNNFIAAASFCRRLLELPEIESEKQANLRTTAKKVLQKSEKEARNEHQIDYNDSTPFVLCSKTLTPLYRGASEARCPYCNAAYRPECRGQLCCICGLSRVGEETLGLVVSSNK